MSNPRSPMDGTPVQPHEFVNNDHDGKQKAFGHIDNGPSIENTGPVITPAPEAKPSFVIEKKVDKNDFTEGAMEALPPVEEDIPQSPGTEVATEKKGHEKKKKN